MRKKSTDKNLTRDVRSALAQRKRACDSATPASVPIPRKTGHPSSFTPELADTICARIADGESLLHICKSVGIPSMGTIFRWLADERHIRFRENYARAREMSAEADADRVGDLVERVLSGEFEPNAARVAIDALKWTSGKKLPKKYGDRVGLVGPDGTGPLEVVLKRIGGDR